MTNPSCSRGMISSFWLGNPNSVFPTFGLCIKMCKKFILKRNCKVRGRCCKVLPLGCRMAQHIGYFEWKMLSKPDWKHCALTIADLGAIFLKTSTTSKNPTPTDVSCPFLLQALCSIVDIGFSFSLCWGLTSTLWFTCIHMVTVHPQDLLECEFEPSFSGRLGSWFRLASHWPKKSRIIWKINSNRTALM